MPHRTPSARFLRLALKKITDKTPIDFEGEFTKISPIKAVKMTEPFEVATLEGKMKGKEGDWLAQGIEGERWPIDAAIFDKTYTKEGLQAPYGTPKDYKAGPMPKVVKTSALLVQRHQMKTVMAMTKSAGWWAIDPETGKELPPAVGKGKLMNAIPGTDPSVGSYYMGDGPLDWRAGFLDDIDRVYRSAWGRGVTIPELKALLDVSVFATAADEPFSVLWPRNKWVDAVNRVCGLSMKEIADLDEGRRNQLKAAYRKYERSGYPSTYPAGAFFPPTAEAAEEWRQVVNDLVGGRIPMTPEPVPPPAPAPSMNDVVPAPTAPAPVPTTWDAAPAPAAPTVAPAPVRQDVIPGGLADLAHQDDFSLDSINQGIQVELEHTNDPLVAREIAMDHLMEDPAYYSKLEIMEKQGEDDFTTAWDRIPGEAGLPREAGRWRSDYSRSQERTWGEDEASHRRWELDRGLELEEIQKERIPCRLYTMLAAEVFGLTALERLFDRIRRRQGRVPQTPLEHKVRLPKGTRAPKFDVPLEKFTEDERAEWKKLRTTNPWVHSCTHNNRKTIHLMWALKQLQEAGEIDANIDYRKARGVDLALAQPGNHPLPPISTPPTPRTPPAPAPAPAPSKSDRHTFDKSRTEEMISLLDQLIELTGHGMFKGFKGDLERGRGLTEKQLSAVRHQLYKNRMKPEADKFRLASADPNEDFDMIRMAKTTGDATRVGLFIPVPEPLASEFPSLGEEDTSPPHVTFLYVGSVPTEKRSQFLSVCLETMSKEPTPIKASLDGLDYFVTPETNTTVAYVPVRFSRDMGSLRDKLSHALQDAGFVVENRFPLAYRPHATLAYTEGVDREVTAYTGTLPKGAWEFDTMAVWGLDKEYDLVMGTHQIEKDWQAPINEHLLGLWGPTLSEK